MSTVPTKKLDRRIVGVWRMSEAIALVVVAAVAVAACYFFPLTWVYIVAGALTALQLLSTLAMPQIRYARWRYEVTNTDVLIRSGLVVVKTSVIPLVRVQHVESKQGPLLKSRNLASVTIGTAGDDFEIPGLAANEAERLRDQVAVLARIAQEDV